MSVSNNTHAIEEFVKTYDTDDKLVKEFGYVVEYLYGKKKKPKKKKDLKDLNITYDFISFQDNIPRLSSIITHVIIFKRNDSDEQINQIEISNKDEQVIYTLDIEWDGQYGQVDLQGKWLNLQSLSNNKLTISTIFSNNYKLYVGQIYVQADGHQELNELDYLIDKFHDEPETIRYLSENEDDNVIFNAVDISKYKSLKLKVMGIERIHLTKNAMTAYKKYVNNKYFLLSPTLWNTQFAKDIQDFYTKLHEKIGHKTEKKNSHIELETVRVY